MIIIFIQTCDLCGFCVNHASALLIFNELILGVLVAFAMRIIKRERKKERERERKKKRRERKRERSAHLTNNGFI